MLLFLRCAALAALTLFGLTVQPASAQTVLSSQSSASEDSTSGSSTRGADQYLVPVGVSALLFQLYEAGGHHSGGLQPSSDAQPSGSGSSLISAPAPATPSIPTSSSGPGGLSSRVPDLPNPSAAPEPSQAAGLCLTALGVLGLTLRARRKRI